LSSSCYFSAGLSCLSVFSCRWSLPASLHCLYKNEPACVSWLPGVLTACCPNCLLSWLPIVVTVCRPYVPNSSCCLLTTSRCSITYCFCL
jgi:hypothetical protein